MRLAREGVKEFFFLGIIFSAFIKTAFYTVYECVPVFVGRRMAKQTLGFVKQHDVFVLVNYVELLLDFRKS